MTVIVAQDVFGNLWQKSEKDYILSQFWDRKDNNLGENRLRMAIEDLEKLSPLKLLNMISVGRNYVNDWEDNNAS